MKEFGSDFHLIDLSCSGASHLTDIFPDAVLLADGRQCIVALIRQYRWKRIWMPDYFCYDVIASIQQQTAIEVLFYEDSPLFEAIVETLPFEEGDVLLRMNYFGARNLRSNQNIPCPVIEDHSHDPLGIWALHSDADWCISSIRKTLPLPEGGMMWSPKGHKLLIHLERSAENEQIAAIRWDGMEKKAAYLRGENISKDEFRNQYTTTEEWFDHAAPVLIDDRSRVVVSDHLDIHRWFNAKRKNWQLLYGLINRDNCEVFEPVSVNCSMFSLMLLFESKEHRDAVRSLLIQERVYPAILWNVPAKASPAAKDFSGRMLSIHCDGRYTEEDIRSLALILNKVLEKQW